jgi:flagellar motor switch/type III secretory pathway protein FliN
MKRQLRVELGHAWLVAEDAARLGPGSDIALLDAAAGEAAIHADGLRVARGELAVMDGCYCVRICEVASKSSDLAARQGL